MSRVLSRMGEGPLVIFRGGVRVNRLVTLLIYSLANKCLNAGLACVL